jgi:superfamily II DNA or RNA helicase
MLDDVPSKALEHLKIPENDIGIDLVIKTDMDEYYAVQVKYRKDISTTINWDCLSTFFGLTFGLAKNFKKGIFFTNTLDPNKYIKNNSNIINILFNSLDDISENTFTKIKNKLQNSEKELITYEPRDYQNRIIKESVKYFHENDKGRLYMPCGTGKTLVCYWISQELKKHKRVCIVVPSLYLLSQTYNTWCEMKKYNYLLVGSDAEVNTCYDTGLLITTSKNDIKKYLEEHETCYIITTYQSSDIFAKVCMKIDYKLDLIIYDEAHKTVGSSNKQFSYLLNDENIKTRKRLFTTATEKIYKHRNKDVSSDDEEDEILSMDNINVYGDVVYNYSFKKAIENEQLCDYQVIAPLINEEGFLKVIRKNKYIIDKNISDDPIESRYYMTAYLICRNIVERKLTHILTFNNTNENAKKIFNILEKMIEEMDIECNCYYLTGETNMKKRKRVVESFKDDKCSIISSARIFQEGVDIPIVDCVCFCDNKLSTIDIIQSIGRVLRKHPNKEKGYILIPTVIDFEENDNIFDMDKTDFGNIKSILKALGTVDERIINEFITCDRRGNNSNCKFIMDSKNIEIIGNVKIDIERMNDKIDSIVCDRWGNVVWEQKLEKCKKYIDENHKYPSTIDKNSEIKKIGIWICTQKTNYSKVTKIMKNKEIRKEWEKFMSDYEEYLKSNEDKWHHNLEKCKKYIGENHKRPSNRIQDIEIKKIGSWIQNQMTYYSKGTKIMKNKKIKKEWEKFVSDYGKYFESIEDKWYDNLEKCKKYIDKNHKRPPDCDKNLEIRKIGNWIGTQLKNYSKGSNIMKNKEIRKEWEKFISDYEEYLKSNEDKWYDNLEKCKKYIDENNRRPSKCNKNSEIKTIGNWIGTQLKNYSKGTNIMKNEEIRNKWEKFAKKYLNI